MKRQSHVIGILAAVLALLIALAACGAQADAFQLPANSKAIDAEAFRNCTSLTGALVIPDGVTEIGDYAFAGCSGLTGVPVIPDTVETIGAHAFDGCIGLSGRLYIPVEVTVDETAFEGCSGLTVTRSLLTVAVVGDDEITDGYQSLNSDVWEAVSAFCDTNGLSARYYIDNVGQAAQDGCDVVFAIGFMEADAVAGAQGNYPNTRFVVLDEFLDDVADNTYCVKYDTKTAGFLAGYAAVKLGYRSLGFMGGIDVPDVVGFGTGFKQGANAAAAELNAEIAMKYTYTGTFMPDPNVKALAEQWYANGTEVIFSCGGSICESVAEAAREGTGRMIIGVDTDQKDLLSGRMVTSAVKALGFTAVDTLETILADGWDGIGGSCDTLGIVSATPGKNHVGLASIQYNNSFTAGDYAALVGRLYRGEIVLPEEPDEEFRVAVIGGEESPWGASLDGDVMRAVSAFCDDQEMDYDYYNDVEDALNDGFNVIIGVSGMFEDVAADNPDVKFIGLDSSPDDGENQQPNTYYVTYKEEQAGYLAGYAAVKLGYRHLAFLGGMRIPPVERYGEGFVNGANDAAAELNVADDVTVDVAYTGVFWPTDEVGARAELLYSRGAEVLFCCGGDQWRSVAEVIKSNPARKIIGVDTDQKASMMEKGVSASQIVTSAMKAVGVSAQAALEQIVLNDNGWDEIGGTCQRLGIVDDLPSLNHVQLAETTAFSGGFTASDYATLVTELNSGARSAGGGERMIKVVPGVTVTTSDELRSLGSPLTDVVRVKAATFEPIDVDWYIEVEGELRVEVDTPENGMAFSSLRLIRDGCIRLAEGGELGTYSDFDLNAGWTRAVAQIWLEGGTLVTEDGTVAPYSTLYVVRGKYVLSEDKGFYIIGSAADEETLQEHLKNELIDEIFLQNADEILLTANATLNLNVQVETNVTVGAGCVLTVGNGGTLSVTNGRVTVDGGQVVVENGGQVNGTIYNKDGTVYPL